MARTRRRRIAQLMQNDPDAREYERAVAGRDKAEIGSRVRTSAIMRHPGNYEHSGAEVASLLATKDADGDARNPGMTVASRRSRSGHRDVMGPIRGSDGWTCVRPPAMKDERSKADFGL